MRHRAPERVRRAVPGGAARHHRRVSRAAGGGYPLPGRPGRGSHGARHRQGAHQPRQHRQRARGAACGGLRQNAPCAHPHRRQFRQRGKGDSGPGGRRDGARHAQKRAGTRPASGGGGVSRHRAQPEGFQRTPDRGGLPPGREGNRLSPARGRDRSRPARRRQYQKRHRHRRAASGRHWGHHPCVPHRQSHPGSCRRHRYFARSGPAHGLCQRGQLPHLRPYRHRRGRHRPTGGKRACGHPRALDRGCDGLRGQWPRRGARGGHRPGRRRAQPCRRLGRRRGQLLRRGRDL